MSAQSLWPQAECTLSRTATRRIERNIGIQQEWNVVARDVKVALVNVGHMRQGVQILDLGSIGIMDDLAVLSIGDTQDLIQRLANRVVNDRVVKFLAANEIDGRTIPQRLLWKHADMRPNKGNPDPRVSFFYRLGELDITGEPRCTGEQHQELVPFRDVDCFLRRDVVRRSVQKPGSLQHSRRISQPHGIPVGLNFAGSWPT